jgi:hypothetical protein
MDVGAFDLVGDNTGPLAELYNLDKGLLVVPLSGTYRIFVTIRYRVRCSERLAEKPTKAPGGAGGEICPKLKVVFNSLILLFNYFLLDRRI